MCTKNGSYCEKGKKSGGRGQGRCERRSEALVIFFFFFFFFDFFFLGGGVGSGGGGEGRDGGGVRVVVNGEVKLL